MKRTNQRQKELVVIAEDEATSRISQGFLTNVLAVRQNRYDLKKYCKGWSDAAELAKAVNLDRNEERYLLLVIDFDRKDERRYERIMEQLRAGGVNLERTFVLGASHEAEPLLKDLREYYHDAAMTFEQAGDAMASECHENKRPSAWEDVPSLMHNCPEVSRLENSVKPFLFKGKNGV